MIYVNVNKSFVYLESDIIRNVQMVDPEGASEMNFGKYTTYTRHKPRVTIKW